MKKKIINNRLNLFKPTFSFLAPVKIILNIITIKKRAKKSKKNKLKGRKKYIYQFNNNNNK